MLKRNILSTLVLIFLIFIIILILLYYDGYFLYLAQNQWLNIVYAFIMALIMGIVIEYIYKKISPKDKIVKSTVTMKPKKMLAKLVLPDGNQCIIKEYERILGREDFLGTMLSDKLQFIGKRHFKITKMDDGFYIEDLNTKNGTWLNNEDIRGLGKKKLNNNDEISIAKVIKIKYNE